MGKGVGSSWLGVGICCAASVAVGLASCTSDPEPVAISYVEIDAAVFEQEVVINAWIHGPTGPDLASIHQHAWDIWSALNAPTDHIVEGTTLPVWETWFDGADLFGATRSVADSESRDLDAPAQLAHAGSARSAGASVLTFNRFNRQMLDHVQQNTYGNSNTLAVLREEFGRAGVPVVDRTIQQFPNTSVMLKPVFWIVPGDRPTPVPYWAGAGLDVATDPQNPDWKTWRQCALVDPTGSASSDEPRVCNRGQDGEIDMAAGDYRVLDLSVDSDELYAFRLTEDEVSGLGDFPMILDNSNVKDDLELVEAGDYAVLVAMHVTTRETANWTWQTFWWTPDRSSVAAEPPDSVQAPASIGAPWDKFNMCAAYSMVTPPGDVDGEPVICFNPYLETNLTGLYSVDRTVTDEVGVHSNCMSCHRAAQVTAGAKAEYAVHGYLEPGDPAWFADGLRTEFAWSVAMRASAG